MGKRAWGDDPSHSERDGPRQYALIVVGLSQSGKVERMKFTNHRYTRIEASRDFSNSKYLPLF